MASVEPEAKEVLLTRAQALFRRTYPELSADIAVFAPGRVNLIGEHTDYTNGFVCPMALTAATVIVGVGDVVDEDAVGSAAAAEGDLLCRIVSTAPGTELAVFDCGRPLTPGGGWSTYVKGVVAEYLGDLPPRKTLVFTFACASSVPLGSGLSSSASLEVAVATFLERVTRRPQPLVTRALRCQSAEHIFANTPCGIMDQFISAMGREGRALLIDCASNKVVQEVQFLSDDYTIVVCDSKVKHNLGESEYPARVRECRSAEAALRSRFGEGNFPNGLRDATPSMVEDLHAAGLIDDVVHRRAFHVVTENDRCQAFAAAMARGDFAAAGLLMNESHASLRDNFEVSCRELDILVDLAQSCKGVAGSRMTGGGFGGCTVTLVRTGDVKGLEAFLQSRYRAVAAKECATFASKPGPGAGELELKESWWQRLESLGDSLGFGLDTPGLEFSIGLVVGVTVAAATVMHLRGFVRQY